MSTKEKYIYSPEEENFVTHFGELWRFICMHYRLPAEEDNDALSTWTQEMLKKGKLNYSFGKKELQIRLPGAMGLRSDTLWNQKAELTKAFIKKYNRLPENEDNKNLRKWIMAQLKALRSGMILSPGKTEQLEHIMQIIAEHGMIIQGKKPEIIYLSRRLKDLSLQLRKKPAAAAEAPRGENKKTRKRVTKQTSRQRWDDLFARLSAFRTHHQRWPQATAAGEEEKQLAGWLHNMRNQKRMGWLDEARLVQLTSIGFPFEKEKEPARKAGIDESRPGES